ncbi:hypothetical protein [Phyllobacterium chamaecytisi]|uniref:hypothetical protein n=1 Tax=Phyllobacterium chamaecytisi TaxID=2876082 RepID=UPI001CCC4223|nr:hypothetical protein [Phyllobacterium sp. KW56]MBZ9605919.1 hypothetical protein [Phyllobacterium sp. KW56]
MSSYNEVSSADHDPSASTTLTAFYEDREMAERAVLRLVDAGIDHNKVRLVEGDDTLDPNATSDERRMGFWESIGDFFFPAEDRDAYFEGVRRGGFLVTVTEVSGELADKALDILDDEGSVDIDERAQSWRSEGWSPTASEDLPPSQYDRTGDPQVSTVEGVASSSGDATADDMDRPMLGPEDEEVQRVATRDMSTGRKRARSYTLKRS